MDLSSCPAELWPAFSRLLDEALDLSEDERAGWLNRLPPEHDAVRPWLKRLLIDERSVPEHFLDAPQLPWLPTMLAMGLDAVVGPYRLTGELGRGGMGAVYSAERVGGVSGHRVALKVVKRGMDTDEILRRFRREREILAQLKHPNITRLIDGGATESGQAWFAMELVEGVPITQWCDAHRATPAERIKLFRTVCAAVQHAHRNLVVHRDLKPSNILVDAEGQVKLLDFGIAKLLGDAAEAQTQSQLKLFTPEYAAPEQSSGAAVTTATDIYQLGLVLRELLCGYRLQRSVEGSALRLAAAYGRSDDARVTEIAAARSMSPAALRKVLRSDLDKIVQQALSDEPARRYDSPAALADDLARWSDNQPVRAVRDSWRYRTTKFLRRHHLAALAATLSIVCLIGAVAVSSVQLARARYATLSAQTAKDFAISLLRNSDPYQGGADTLSVAQRLDRSLAGANASLTLQPEQLADVESELCRVLKSLDRQAALLECWRHVVAAYRAFAATDDARRLRAEVDYLRDRQRIRDETDIEPDALDLIARIDARDTALAPLRRVAMSTLADHYLASGSHERAARIASDSLESTRTALGERSYETSIVLFELARIRFAQGRLDEAERWLTQSTQIDLAVVDSDHPGLLTDAWMIGKLLAARGQFAQAHAIFTRVAARRAVQFGPTHTYTLFTEVDLATIEGETGAYASARERLHAALTGLDQQHSQTGAHYAEVHARLATIELAQDHLDAAEAEIAAAEKALAPAGAAAALTDLVQRLRIELTLHHSAVEASAMLRDALAVRSEEDLDRPALLLLDATTQRMLGHAATAQARAESALRLLGDQGRGGHPLAAKAHLELGRLALLSGDSGGASAEFLTSAELACRALGCDAAAVSEALGLALSARGEAVARIAAERARLVAQVAATPAVPSALADLGTSVLDVAEHAPKNNH